MAEQNDNVETKGPGRENGAKPKSKRGFAAMSPEKQKSIASLGGKAAHQQGVAHEWSKEEAKEAGRKGGQSKGKTKGA